MRIADTAGEILSMHALVSEGSEEVPDAPCWFNRVLASPPVHDVPGTREILRNIIGERVLGFAKG